MELKNLIKMFKIGKRMSPPIPLVMKIIIWFDWRMKPSLCFIGHKDSHPKFHRRENHFWFSLVHEGWRAIDWKEGFPNFHWTRRMSSRKGHGGLPRRERSILCVRERKGGEWKCEKEITFYVWKCVVHGKDVCKQEQGSCV